jgi:flavodoxin
VKALVIYDTNFGSTKAIAEAVARELGRDARAISVTNFAGKDLDGVGLVVVGSPIIGWRPAQRMAKFLAGLEPGQLNGIKAAAFDTRVRLFIHGDAAGKIARKLEAAGALLLSEPQPFYVRGREGPLFDGEVKRAAEWARSLKTGLSLAKYASGIIGLISERGKTGR